MTHNVVPAYGLGPIVVINSLVFLIFAFSFTQPQSGRDWRSFGAFSAFIVALFTEMYGFPLTIYLVSGWLQSWHPEFDLMSHDAGHLWYSVFGLKGDPHANPLHLVSEVLIFGGFILLAAAWRVLHRAQAQHALARTGLYARLRHPQYAAFIAIMFGFLLLQWPTLLTLVMFPVLVTMYVRLARREEAEARRGFGAAYDPYAAVTPGWFPRLGGRSSSGWPMNGAW